MALQCLYNYTGDTVVHVGELFGQSLCLPGAWYVSNRLRLPIYHRLVQYSLTEPLSMTVCVCVS